MKSLQLTAPALEVEGWFHAQIQRALTELLETKQLYQTVTVDVKPVELSISRVHHVGRIINAIGVPVRTQEDMNRQTQIPYREALSFFSAAEWSFDVEYYPQRTAGHNGGAGPIFFRTPTIKVACSFCDAVLPPHNSGYLGFKDKIHSTQLGRADDGACMQVFTFPFVCQSCKEHPIVYLITRRGLKLTYSGRSEFPIVEVPKFLPDEEKDYFRKAMISHAAGHTLAAILYLRVFVEQYLRRVTSAAGRKTGAELGDLYRPLLHEDFPKNFETLATIYDELSEKIHDADASAEQFAESKRRIERHFRQLELLPLKIAT